MRFTYLPSTHSIDSNGDETLESIWTYTYDKNGNKLNYYLYSNRDENPDLIRAYTYDLHNDPGRVPSADVMDKTCSAYRVQPGEFLVWEGNLDE